MTGEEVKEVEKEESTFEPKGFKVFLDEEGTIKIDPFGLANDLELLGLMDFVDAKKQELVKHIAMSPEVKNLRISGSIAQGLASLLKAVSAPEEETKE